MDAEDARWLVGADAAAELARLAIERRNWDRADWLLEHAIGHGRLRDPELWRMRARVALARSDADYAFDAAVYAYALQPMSRENTALMIEVLDARGQGDRAAGLKRKLARMSG